MAIGDEVLAVASLVVPAWGAFAFGIVLGWITYRTLRHMEGKPTWQDLSTILGILLGAAVTTIFGEPTVFGSYCLGLAAGFFGYLGASLRMMNDWKQRAAAQYAKDKTLPPDPPAELNIARWMGAHGLTDKTKVELAPQPGASIGRSPPKQND